MIDERDLIFHGVAIKRHAGARAIAELVAQLRAELKANQEWFRRNVPRGAARP